MSVTQGHSLASSADCVDSRIRRRFRLIGSLLLFLATLGLYNGIRRAPYLNYDDNAYVYENFHVRSGLNRGTLVWAFTTTSESNWHPITWLSHSLDVTLFGLNPAGPHYVNVLLHATNTILLFLLLESSTKLAWRSLAVAALFAVHPLNVESVAWISERKNVLSALLFLLALAAYGWYTRRPAVGRYLLLVVCFALALMAKPQVITLPFALLLLDYWPLARTNSDQGDDSVGPTVWRLIIEKLPLFGLSAASGWITMKAQVAAVHLDFPLTVRLENATLSYVKYIAKTLWPVDLATLYPHPGLSVSGSRAALAALALLAITISVVHSRRRYLLVGWFWFLGTLVPMIGLVQVGVQAMADRYSYIPGIGLFVMICWGFGDFFEKWQIRPAWRALLAAGILCLLALASSRYLAYWTDNVRLWSHTLQVTKNNFIADDSIGDALLKRGRMDEAVAHFEHAASINPQDPIANLNLGAYEQLKQNYGAAIARFETVLRITQNPRLLALALTNLGYAHYSEGDADLARRCFQSALREQAENPRALLGLGVLAYASGDIPSAIDEYRNALHLQASDLGYLLIAEAFEKAGNLQSAAQAREEAKRISPEIDAARLAADRLLRPNRRTN